MEARGKGTSLVTSSTAAMRGNAGQHMLPAEIAETYLHLAKQHRSTWTHELDLRAFLGSSLVESLRSHGT
jgi:hypothetical protein